MIQVRPGEYLISKEQIIANVGRKMINLKVSNTGDRPIQVGSHAHFFEVNKFLSFQREKAYGFHLNIPSGLSVRFEPGETKVLELVEYGGKKIVYGFNGLVNGELQKNKTASLEKAKLKGFKGA